MQIRSVHSGFCLSEKRGSDSGRLYQVPCEQETIPSFSLKPLDGDAWRIVTDHPDYDLGCTGVWDGMRDAGAGLQDQECGKRGDAEEFLIESVGRPVEGYRIRPAHTRLCVGAEGNSEERGAELVQTSCDGADRGSLFSFDPVAEGTAAWLSAYGGGRAAQPSGPGTPAARQNRSRISARNNRPSSPVVPARSVPVLLQLSVDTISAW